MDARVPVEVPAEIRADLDVIQHVELIAHNLVVLLVREEAMVDKLI